MSERGSYLHPTVFGLKDDSPLPIYTSHALHNMVGTQRVREFPNTEKRKQVSKNAKTALLNLSNIQAKLENSALPNISLPKTQATMKRGPQSNHQVDSVYSNIRLALNATEVSLADRSPIEV